LQYLIGLEVIRGYTDGQTDIMVVS
jgi:hypothetical protein